MADELLSRLIGSQKRARILRIFIFNPADLFTIRLLTKRAGMGPEAIAREIRFLEQAGIIKRGRSLPAPERAWKQTRERKKKGGGKKEKAWILNPKFKFLRALSMFVHEISPVHYRSIVTALQKAGRMTTVILSGNFMGDPTRPADLVVAGENVNESRLDQIVRKMEPSFGREIRYAWFTTPEFRYRLTIQDRLIRDTLDFPHVTLLDKVKVL